MNKKTKITKKEKVAIGENDLVLTQTNEDIKNAVLVVSLVANAFVLITWIALQVTTTYDGQIAAFLFAR